MTRHWTARAAIVAVLLASWAAATASGAAAQPRARAHAASREATAIVRPTVATAGKYVVVVSVRARGEHSRLVRVFLTGQAMRTIRANPWWGARLYYELHLKSTKLTVRVVNNAPAVQVMATLRRKNAAKPTTTKPAPTTPPPVTPPTTTTTTTTTTTSTSTASTPPPPRPPPPPPTGDPCASTTWCDNFAKDYTSGASQANRLPSSSTWSLDSWGGCGGGTLSNNTTNKDPNAAKYASLSPNGLAITAVSNGNGSYTSAQVDSVGHQSFLNGTISASIQMPPGQGLCSAFWLLGDNNVPGGSLPGEIDVVEAPSFTAPPVNAVFDLHGPIQGTSQTQQFQASTTALGDLSGGFHTYAVTWTPLSIAWTIDGIQYAYADQSKLVSGSSWSQSYQSSKFHLIFDVAVGGWPCDASACTPPSSATMYVRWVKVVGSS